MSWCGIVVSDHLARWWQVRAEVQWRTASTHVAGPVNGLRDGFADHVRSVSARDALRSARLISALNQVAQATELTLERLVSWQATVLGVPDIVLRDRTAYAKGGRETYGLKPDTWRRFDVCLAEATDPLIPLPSRAARIYLDVSFVHPFPDGNARAAMLCLAFVLRRDKVKIDMAAPILQVIRTAGDLTSTLNLVRLIEILIAASAKRAAKSGAAVKRYPPSCHW